MGVIAVSTLKVFWEKPGRRDAEEPLKTWYREAVQSDWKSPQDIKARYGSANFVGGNRVVFNMAGSKYRLIVALAYRMQVVSIKFVGTHAEYDKIDATSVDAT